MADEAGYKQFCPVSMAAEVICTRWTVVLLRELVAGSTRFNDIRRGVPKMSPSLLAKRLRDLESAGVVERRAVPGEGGVHEYLLTDSGRELRAVVESIGFWGQKWIESSLSLKNLDPSLLMWDMRRNLWTAPIEWSGLNVSAWWASGPSGRWFRALGDGIPRRCGA